MLSLSCWVGVAQGKQLYSAGDEPDALHGIDAGLPDLAIPIIDDELCVIHRAGTDFWIGDDALTPMVQRTLTLEVVTEISTRRQGGSYDERETIRNGKENGLVDRQSRIEPSLKQA